MLRVYVPQQVGKRVKQDIMIADHSGKSTLTLWDSDVNAIEVNTSYHFNQLEIRKYMAKTYLSSQSTPSFQQIDPITETQLPPQKRMISSVFQS